MSNDLMKVIDSIEVNEVASTLNRVAEMQTIVSKSLKEGHDYGTIPGTPKPTLYKPGAEKILMLFGLTSEYEIINQIEDWQKGVFSYTVKAIISSGGNKVTEGLGSCNSLEDKYRYRWAYESEVPVHLDKSQLKKNEKTNKYRIPNDEIYTQVNTLLKMAKKRAQIDAVLTVASLSEVFTQDVEDLKTFLDSEATDNLTLKDVRNTKVTFGKHKGKTLEQLEKEDIGYLKWLKENALDAFMRKAVGMILSDPLDNAESALKEDIKQKEKMKYATPTQVREIADRYVDKPEKVKEVLEGFGIMSSKQIPADQLDMIKNTLEVLIGNDMLEEEHDPEL